MPIVIQRYHVRFSWPLHLVVDYLGGKGTAHAFTAKWIDHRGGVKHDKTMTSGVHESTRDLLNALTPSARRGSSSTIQNIVTTCNMYYLHFSFLYVSRKRINITRFTICIPSMFKRNVQMIRMKPNIYNELYNFIIQ